MAYPGGFREYMEKKRIKLAEQGQAKRNVNVPQIFAGLTFYFNGYTGEITRTEFIQQCLDHGAHIIDYLQSNVTHIIATTLTDSKINQWRSKPIVRPDWISRCINQGKLLDWRLFRLHSVDPTQSTLKPSHLLNVSKNNSSSSLEERAHEIQNWYENETPMDMQSRWVKENSSVAPNFVQNYFGSSRLHHISRWKMELVDFVDTERKKRPETILDGEKIILHVDMDCFFASVATSNSPELSEQPVAVAHSQGIHRNSTSEIASCNYVARSFGIQNGMSVGRARKLCPQLVVLPYEFEKYRMASEELYKVLLNVTTRIQAVSCDEAFIELSFPEKLAEKVIDAAQNIRTAIYEKIKCHCSIGIAANMLMARIATKKAKPNGIYFISEENAEKEIQDLSISELPGVGWSTAKKLIDMKVNHCKDLRSWPLHQLQKLFGEKIGKTLYQHCRGMDERILEHKDRKSIGAEVNWGIRFQTWDDVQAFLLNLCHEINRRMIQQEVCGQHLTVKVKKKKYQGEPQKVLGCGICDNLSKSIDLKQSTSNPEIIFQESYRLLKKLPLIPEDIRGIGLHLTKLSSPKAHKTIKGMFSQPVKPVDCRVDEKVLAELPENIRREILADCRYQIIGLSYSKTQQESKRPVYDFFGVTKSEEVENLIGKADFDSFDASEWSVFFQHVTNYLSELINDTKLGSAQRLLSLLNQKLSITSPLFMKELYSTLNHHCLERYHCTLIY